MKRYFYKSKNGIALLNLKSPIDDKNYIEITEDEFNELTKATEPSEAQKAIGEAMAYLARTDYIVLKLAEAQADGDTAKVEEIKAEYAEVLAQRKEKRNLINRLQG